MFDLLDTPLFSLGFRMIVLFILAAGLRHFFNQAKEQFKAAKTILAILDEVLWCFVIVAGALIVIAIKPSQIFEFAVTPLIWVWEGILFVLRAIGFPI